MIAVVIGVGGFVGGFVDVVKFAFEPPPFFTQQLDVAARQNEVVAGDQGEEEGDAAAGCH